MGEHKNLPIFITELEILYIFWRMLEMGILSDTETFCHWNIEIIGTEIGNNTPWTPLLITQA